MQLLVIKETAEANKQFIENPLCSSTIYMCMDFYKRVGFNPPWLCYYVESGGEIIGSAAFKGQPAEGKVEIAYGTMEQHQRKGVATAICKVLIELALQTDPTVIVTARTLPELNFSTRVLQKNNFILNGMVADPEDGEVWEWVFSPAKP